MDISNIRMEPLHRRPDLIDDCADLLNAQWPRSKAARLHSLDKSRDELPYSLVMVANEQGRSSPAVIGYCRLVRVISMPSSVLIESVVVPEHLRGKGIGRQVMEMAETHAKSQGYTTMFLNTKDKQGFYSHLGYEFCSPVNTLNAQMLETCDCSPTTPSPPCENQTPCSSNSCTSVSQEPRVSDVRLSEPDGGCLEGREATSDNRVDVQRDNKVQSVSNLSHTLVSVPPPPPPPPLKLNTFTTLSPIYWMKKDVS
ncbi:N-alpha-acetyltransferase 80-like [Asterias rubens]|uniref:N-alpha-acetyltransferase 80-like n=1 Tax=Asterias rubens TaxID=7604 RepID=UPI0014550111|nr:N-alpha-acetyltransferase 80-like [Asterias rubens]